MVCSCFTDKHLVRGVLHLMAMEQFKIGDSSNEILSLAYTGYHMVTQRTE